MEYKTFKPGDEKVGLKVISHSDHNGKILEGIIFEIKPLEIRVNYIGLGSTTLKRSGR